MSIPVSLQEVVDNLQMQMELMAVFLNEETGEMIVVQDDELKRADDLIHGDLKRDDLRDWEREFLPKVHEAIHDPGWSQLPTEWDLNEYEMMKQFCYSVKNDEHREQLLRAIRGRGAFRYFRDTTDRLGLTKDWYAYRDRAYEKRAVQWLEARDVPYVREEEN